MVISIAKVVAGTSLHVLVSHLSGNTEMAIIVFHDFFKISEIEKTDTEIPVRISFPSLISEFFDNSKT